MTDNTNAPPSKNPANLDSLAGAMQVVLTKFLQGTDNMLPCKIIAYDRSTNLAQVQPLIQMVTTLNQIVSRNQVMSVPVLQLGGGGFVMSFPMKTGDLGWLHANDRDISLFLETFAESPPNTNRKHSFSDGVVIPDCMLQGVTIASEDTANAVLQSLDGTVRISLFPDKVKITAPTVEIDAAALNVTGDVVAQFGTSNISLTNHVHSGVQSGSSNSGPPVP